MSFSRADTKIINDSWNEVMYHAYCFMGEAQALKQCLAIDKAGRGDITRSKKLIMEVMRKNRLSSMEDVAYFGPGLILAVALAVRLVNRMEGSKLAGYLNALERASSASEV
jgi:hypothetical protein